MIEQTIQPPRRPIVRYHGGKWKLAPWIIEHMPPHRVYVEPFGGGGSVLLRKERAEREVYNDLDGRVVNFFRVLRDPEKHKELTRQLNLTPYALEEFEAAYDKAADEVENARRFFVLGWQGYGSTAVTSRKNTGWRNRDKEAGIGYACEFFEAVKNIEQVAARLRGVYIDNRPALELMPMWDNENVLYYVDPPYLGETRGNTSKYRHELTDDQHRELADCLHSLKGMVMLSGYPSEMYDDLYGDWSCLQRSHYADSRAKRTECLWLNPACIAAQRQMEMPL